MAAFWKSFTMWYSGLDAWQKTGLWMSIVIVVMAVTAMCLGVRIVL